MADQNINSNFTANLNPLLTALDKAKNAIDEFASKSPQGVRKLDNAFKDLSLQSIGVTGNIGRLGDALLEFIPGGIIGAGVVGGIGAIVMAIKYFKDQEKEAQEAAKTFSVAITEQNIAYIKLKDGIEAATKAQIEYNINIAKAKVKDATDEVVRLERATRDQISAETQLGKQQALTTGTAVAATTEAVASAKIRSQNSRLQVAATTTLAQANKELLDAEYELKQFNENASAAATKAGRARQEQLEKERRAIDEMTIAYRKLMISSQESALKGFEERMKAEADRIAAMRKNISDELTKTIDTDKLSQDIEESFRGVQLVSPEIDKIMLKQQQSYNTMSLVAQAASEGWQMMFEVIGQGGNALGNLGKGFARLTAGLAKTKAAENIAYAVENLAKAFGFIALGNTASTAAAGKAAAGHFKAAALWGALGGGATALAGGTSGPGGIGGGGAFSQSMVGQNTFTTQQPLTIIVQGGLLDMSNPETQRSFTSALETVTNRRVRMVGA